MIIVNNPRNEKAEEENSLRYSNGYSKNKHPLIISILENNNGVINIENESFKKFNFVLVNNDILFYPSSFDDISDLLKFNNEILPELEANTPSVYIHSELGENSMCYVRDRLEKSKEFKIIETALSDSIEKAVSLFELKIISSGKTIWLLQFTGTPNEELLKLFINKGISIKYIFSVCDGITHGMGGDDELENISTIYYPYFYKILNTKYHITEFHSDDYYKKARKLFYETQKNNLINFSNHLKTIFVKFFK